MRVCELYGNNPQPYCKTGPFYRRGFSAIFESLKCFLSKCSKSRTLRGASCSLSRHQLQFERLGARRDQLIHAMLAQDGVALHHSLGDGAQGASKHASVNHQDRATVVPSIGSSLEDPEGPWCAPNNNQESIVSAYIFATVAAHAGWSTAQHDDDVMECIYLVA